MTIARGLVTASLGALLVAGVSGCQQDAPANRGSVDINGAAEQAQGDIDTYASNALQTPTEAASNAPLPPPEAKPTPAPLNPPAPGEPGGLPDDRTPISEAPFTPDSAQGAANVVQTYFALIEQGRYHQAWALWGDGGKASGMNAAAFAQSFARYSEYHANVGAPSGIDAGAGQRYVTVPVQAYGRLKESGKPFNQLGKITLHRTADIDGATAEQKSWHISASTLTPVPKDESEAPPLTPIDEADGVPPTASASYRCEDGFSFDVAFDNRANTATIKARGKTLAVLDAKRAASGIWYAGTGFTLRGKGDSAAFDRPGHDQTQCRAR